MESGRIDSEKAPGRLGVTYEMCAGIVDKDCSVEQIAKEEVLEECGYDVPLRHLEKITVCRWVMSRWPTVWRHCRSLVSNPLCGATIKVALGIYSLGDGY